MTDPTASLHFTLSQMFQKFQSGFEEFSENSVYRDGYILAHEHFQNPENQEEEENLTLNKVVLEMLSKRDKNVRKKMNIQGPIDYDDGELVPKHVAEYNEKMNKIGEWIIERNEREWFTKNDEIQDSREATSESQDSKIQNTSNLEESKKLTKIQKSPSKTEIPETLEIQNPQNLMVRNPQQTMIQNPSENRIPRIQKAQSSSRIQKPLEVQKTSPRLQKSTSSMVQIPMIQKAQSSLRIQETPNSEHQKPSEVQKTSPRLQKATSSMVQIPRIEKAQSSLRILKPTSSMAQIPRTQEAKIQKPLDTQKSSSRIQKAPSSMVQIPGNSKNQKSLEVQKPLDLQKSSSRLQKSTKSMAQIPKIQMTSNSTIPEQKIPGRLQKATSSFQIPKVQNPKVQKPSPRLQKTPSSMVQIPRLQNSQSAFRIPKIHKSTSSVQIPSIQHPEPKDLLGKRIVKPKKIFSLLQ